jgi:hypothetical protein
MVIISISRLSVFMADLFFKDFLLQSKHFLLFLLQLKLFKKEFMLKLFPALVPFS